MEVNDSEEPHKGSIETLALTSKKSHQLSSSLFSASREEKSHRPSEFLEWLWELFVSPGHHFPAELENRLPRHRGCHHLASVLQLHCCTALLQQVWVRLTYTTLSVLKENCLLVIYQLLACPMMRFNLRYLSRWHVSNTDRRFLSKVIKKKKRKGEKKSLF